MRVPLDRPLASWIRELMAEGKIYRFYKTEDWKLLRNRVLEEFHHECADCREKGIYSKAVMVHHDQEVRHRPDMALSEWWTDGEGKKRRNLWPLCFDCHEARHGRAFKGKKNESEGFINEERW